MLVLDEVTETAFLVVAHGGFQRHRLLHDPHQSADLVRGESHFGGDLIRLRLPSELAVQRTVRADELVPGLDHVHRDADRRRRVDDPASDALPDPPAGIGGEAVPEPVVELLRRAHESHVAFLNQVQELQTAVAVLLREAHHQPQVGLDEDLLGRRGLVLGGGDGLHLTRDVGGGRSQGLFDGRDFGCDSFGRAAARTGARPLCQLGQRPVRLLEADADIVDPFLGQAQCLHGVDDPRTLLVQLDGQRRSPFLGGPLPRHLRLHALPLAQEPA